MTKFSSFSHTPQPSPPLARPRRSDPFDLFLSRAFRWSAGAHLAVLVGVVLTSLIFPSKPISYIPSLRVDLVGLPDVLKKDLGKLAALPPVPAAEEPQTQEEPKTASKEKAPEIADPEEMVLKPKSEKRADTSKPQDTKRDLKMKSALARMKALAKIQEETAEQPTVGAVIKGNTISKGTSLSGEARESQGPSYYDLVRDRLQRNWELPVWIARQNLSAQIDLFIDTRGTVRAIKFVRTSGNPQFDEAIKRTIAESQPFPAPPKEMTSSLLAHGISVGFPL